MTAEDTIARRDGVTEIEVDDTLAREANIPETASLIAEPSRHPIDLKGRIYWVSTRVR
ncbi:hypothetical protein [Microbacterium sp. USTB-Y]|uniref:hypothetical protein n=1 Tax=Microbacterium sp. USTB-Y TaxID=2823692 RepID=UPI00203E1376|nr:hypothetical protein [Microbacterium sp. USTB-Y]